MTKRQESGFNWRGVEFVPEEYERRSARGNCLPPDTQFFSHPMQSNRWFGKLLKISKTRMYSTIKKYDEVDT